MTIVDNNVLSALAKIHRLDLLATVFDDVATTPGVIEELDTARLEGYQFVDRIESRRDEWLEVVTPTTEELMLTEEIRDRSLSFVDAECLAIAETRHRRLVSDDRHVGTVARDRGIDVWDLPLLIQAGISGGAISDEDELGVILHDLEERDSYRFSSDVESRLYEAFR